jgi:chromosome segregation ATPase
MAIQNARSRKTARKEKPVEAQEAIRHSHNGVEHSAAVGIPEMAAPTMLTLNRDELQERREKMAVALKGLKADKEDLAQQKTAIEEQMKNQTTAIQRTEGALFMLDQVLGQSQPPQEGG